MSQYRRVNIKLNPPETEGLILLTITCNTIYSLLITHNSFLVSP